MPTIKIDKILRDLLDGRFDVSDIELPKLTDLKRWPSMRIELCHETARPYNCLRIKYHPDTDDNVAHHVLLDGDMDFAEGKAPLFRIGSRLLERTSYGSLRCECAMWKAKGFCTHIEQSIRHQVDNYDIFGRPLAWRRDSVVDVPLYVSNHEAVISVFMAITEDGTVELDTEAFVNRAFPRRQNLGIVLPGDGRRQIRDMFIAWMRAQDIDVVCSHPLHKKITDQDVVLEMNRLRPTELDKIVSDEGITITLQKIYHIINDARLLKDGMCQVCWRNKDDL